MKQLINELISGTPLELVKWRINADLRGKKGDLYDLHTISIMKRVLGKRSNCVDVGCAEAKLLRWMQKLSPEGEHYAFEPIPTAYQKLVKLFAKHDNVQLFNLALSNLNGESSFQHVIDRPTYSGLKERTYTNASERIEQIMVRTARLDDIVPRSQQIDFIKIDVEGAELLVLKGALETIRNSRPVIVFEHGLGAADHYGTSPEDVYSLLVSQCGLAISLMADWLRDPSMSPLTAEEFSKQYYDRLNFYFVACPCA
jgi:FkbM family methyltransferase